MPSGLSNGRAGRIFRRGIVFGAPPWHDVVRKGLGIVGIAGAPVLVQPRVAGVRGEVTDVLDAPLIIAFARISPERRDFRRSGETRIRAGARAGD